MFEYSSVRTSSWDTDNLVAQLNQKAAEGWRVVSVVNTGSDIVAVVERTASGAATALATGATGAGTAGEAVEDTVTEVAVLETVEPAGWGSAPSTTGETAVDTTVDTTVDTPADTVGATDLAGAAAATAIAPEPSPVTSTEPEPTPVASTEPEPTAASAAAAAATDTGAAAAAASSSIPANWYPDPSGRYELRYWDGQQWTEHVARGGQRFTDPPVA